jgi:hypothetical protein
MLAARQTGYVKQLLPGLPQGKLLPSSVNRIAKIAVMYNSGNRTDTASTIPVMHTNLLFEWVKKINPDGSYTKTFYKQDDFRYSGYVMCSAIWAIFFFFLMFSNTNYLGCWAKPTL